MWCWLSPIRSRAIASVSSGLNRFKPLNCNSTNCPSTSTCGNRPGEKIRSLICGRLFVIAVMSLAVRETGATAGGAPIFCPFGGTASVFAAGRVPFVGLRSGGDAMVMAILGHGVRKRKAHEPK
jgi:hypothetical protein